VGRRMGLRACEALPTLARPQRRLSLPRDISWVSPNAKALLDALSASGAFFDFFFFAVSVMCHPLTSHSLHSRGVTKSRGENKRPLIIQARVFANTKISPSPRVRPSWSPLLTR